MKCTTNKRKTRKTRSGIYKTTYQKTKKTRKRKRTWLTSSFSKNVGTNVAKNTSLLNAYFPAENKVHKIINRNAIKLSYSCKANIEQIIKNYNKSITSIRKEKEERTDLQLLGKSYMPAQREMPPRRSL